MQQRSVVLSTVAANPTCPPRKRAMVDPRKEHMKPDASPFTLRELLANLTESDLDRPIKLYVPGLTPAHPGYRMADFTVGDEGALWIWAERNE